MSTTNPDILFTGVVWIPSLQQHWGLINGTLVVAEGRADVAQVELNKRYTAMMAGIRAGEISVNALAATIAEDDPDADAEFELLYAGNETGAPEKPKEPKTAWERANAHFRAAMAGAGFLPRETPEARAARLQFLSEQVNRPVSSTRDMTPDELISAARMLERGEVSANWKALELV